MPIKEFMYQFVPFPGVFIEIGGIPKILIELSVLIS